MLLFNNNLPPSVSLSQQPFPQGKICFMFWLTLLSYILAKFYRSTFLFIHIKHLCGNLDTCYSCPPLLHYEFKNLSCWAGVMIMHGNPLWYTKLVLTTDLPLDSLCPKTIDLPYNTHLTVSSPLVGVKEGTAGCGVGWWLPNYRWKMWVAKKFIKHCRFPWHIDSLASPCGSPL